MKKISRDILCKMFKHWNHFCFGLFSVITGIYVLLHQGYLDDPRVTPPPQPPYFEHLIFSLADAWWFGAWTVMCGIVILIGVFGSIKKFRVWGLVALSPSIGGLSVAFIIRGIFDYRFNLTWIFSLLMLAIMIGTIIRGDTHEL